jgi:hypothetical protein
MNSPKVKVLNIRNILFCVLFPLLGCGMNAGLNRTPVGEIFRFDFSSIGISVLLPLQPDDQNHKYRIDILDSATFRKNAKLKGKIYFGFHPIHGYHLMSEPDYLIDINLIRFSEKQFGLFKQGKHYLLADPCYQKIDIEQSPPIKEKVVHDRANNKDYRCFFKTMVFENGDLLVASGRLLLTGNLYTDNDIPFIRSIIDSVVLVED